MQDKQQENKGVFIKEVVIDGLVVLKIVKHSKENMPKLVTGQLFGIDRDDTVEITNCYPIPRTKIDSDKEYESNLARKILKLYEQGINSSFEKVNFDVFNVGWYQSTYLGSFMNSNFIRSQYEIQSNKLLTNKCIVLVYDEVLTRKSGKLSLKAIRLTNKFMDLPEFTITQEHLRERQLTYKDVFEEIPIRIRNSVLIDAFLYQLKNTNKIEPNFENLDLSFNLYMEKNIKFLGKHIDELNSDFNNYKRYFYEEQKQKSMREEMIRKKEEENKIREEQGLDKVPISIDKNFRKLVVPPRNSSLILSNQVSIYVDQINEHANDSSTKLFLRQLLIPGAINTNK